MTTLPPSVTTPTATPGVSGYNTGGPSGSIAPLQGPSATAPAPSSLADSMWPVLPSSLSNYQIRGMTNGSPGEKKGTDKGAMDPNLTRIGDLIRILDAVHSQNFSQINVGTFQDVLNTAGISRAAVWSQSTSSFAPDNDQEKAIVGVAYKMLMQKLPEQGIATNPMDRTPPTIHDIPAAIQRIGTLALNPHTIAHLQYQGRDTTSLQTVRDLVQQNDKLAQGAPGALVNSPRLRGAPDTQSGKDYYKQMMNAYNSNSPQGQGLVTNLNALGMLDITDAVPTGKAVGAGVQRLMKAAEASGLSPSEYAAQAISDPTAFNKRYGTDLPNRTQSPQRAYVEHVVDSLGTPISEDAKTSIANAMIQMPTGVDTEDWVAQQVAAAATQHIQQNPSLNISDYKGMTLGIAEAVRSSFAAQGVAITPLQLNQSIAKTLSAKPTTIYAANEQAQSVGSQAARDVATQMYGSLAPQISQGQSVASLAQPYLSVASQTLGIPAAEMNITNPQWMKWAQGGTDGKTLMSPTEWASTLMTDPQYGFAKSQPEKNLQAAGAGGILDALGLSPTSGATSIPSSASTAGLTTSTGA